jgi:hypothetical protein
MSSPPSQSVPTSVKSFAVHAGLAGSFFTDSIQVGIEEKKVKNEIYRHN